MKYYCKKCKNLIASEDVVEWQEYETGYINRHCPCCGGDVEEAERCKICGAWIAPGEEYCGECAGEVCETLYYLRRTLRTDWTTFVDMIDKYLEGEL